MMDRRGFLARLGGTSAAVVTAGALGDSLTPPTAGDEMSYLGYRVKWSDWHTLPNQNVVCGMWCAKHDSQDLEWVSTSLGQCYPSRAWEVVDMSRGRGWPLLTIFATDAERAEVKARAKAALWTALEQAHADRAVED